MVIYRSCHRPCSVKKVFLEISQNSQEKTCARVFFLIKLQTSGLRSYLSILMFALRAAQMHPTFHPTFFSYAGWDVGLKFEFWMSRIIYICTLSSTIIIQHFKDHSFFENSKWWTHVHLHK